MVPMSDNKSQEYVFDVNDLPKVKTEIGEIDSDNERRIDISKKETGVDTSRARIPDFLKIRESDEINLTHNSLGLEQQIERENAERKRLENEKLRDLGTQEERLERFRQWERERDDVELAERNHSMQKKIESDEAYNTDIPTENNYEDAPQLDLSKTLTEDEYVSILEELNEDAENKNYVFLFGIPGSGKSYIIASLLKYMEQSDLGQSRLDLDKSNDLERRLYNRMIMSFTDPKKYRIESNATLDFNRFNIIFTPKGNKPEKTITFLDISGEACL